MSADTDLFKLYSTRILGLAASLPGSVRLDRPDATARKRSPLCGSSVVVDVVVRDGRIAEFGHDVKACALGQASASVLAAHAVGRSEVDIRAARDTLAAMLTEAGPPPGPPFDDLEALLPARDFANRHASILLGWDATLAAFAALRAEA